MIDPNVKRLTIPGSTAFSDVAQRIYQVTMLDGDVFTGCLDIRYVFDDPMDRPACWHAFVTDRPSGDVVIAHSARIALIEPLGWKHYRMERQGAPWVEVGDWSEANEAATEEAPPAPTKDRFGWLGEARETQAEDRPTFSERLGRDLRMLDEIRKAFNDRLSEGAPKAPKGEGEE